MTTQINSQGEPIDLACPHCGEIMDAATPLDRDRDAKPSPGDFAVCIGCGEPSVYTQDGTLRPHVPEDWDNITTEQVVNMALARKAIREGHFREKEGQ